jgi:hypothetical protein
MNDYRYLIITILIGFITPTYAVVKVSYFPKIAVDKSNVNNFSTPLSYYQGTIFTVNVEPGSTALNKGINLKTIVRKSVPVSSDQWNWISQTIDDETIEDKYHTQASIGIDKQGYLHIAYGMHNMPWQYVISNSPGNISNFTFLGDPITIDDKKTVKNLNKTPFSSIGYAIVQGNQITYPAFFNDIHNNLYITYRFAVKPKRSFGDRVFAIAIARYNIETKKWLQLGADILLSQKDADWGGLCEAPVTNPFALTDQWTVYFPRLAFDKDNGMHVSWLWRKGIAGGDTTHPSYAFSPDDDRGFFTSHHLKYTLPISVLNADWIGPLVLDKFSATSEIIADDTYVYVVLHRLGETRELFKLNRLSGEWLKELMPYSASTLKIDLNGGQWAFATGLTVFFRKNDQTKWKIVYSDKNDEKYGYPKVLQIPGKNEFYIHTQSLSEVWVKIYKLKF